MRLFIMAFSFLSISNAFWGSQQVVKPADLLIEFGQAPAMSSKTSADFTLTNWNVYKGGMSGMHADLDALIDSSDFVLIQEFLLSEEQNEQIEKWTHLHWALAKSFKDGGEWTGVATVSKWQPFESLPVKSPGTEPFANTPKMSLISKYNLANGEVLWLVNIHALNFDLTHQAFKDQVKALVDIMKNHNGPLIFAGDFNTWSDERYQYLLQLTGALGLERADIENPIGFLSATLDHIFYRGFLSVNPSLLDQVTSSDHNPLRLEFTLRPGPAATAGL